MYYNACDIIFASYQKSNRFLKYTTNNVSMLQQFFMTVNTKKCHIFDINKFNGKRILIKG